MDINSILCIGRDELMERKKQISHDLSRRVSSSQHYYRHEGLPNSVVEIYSPSYVDRHGTRFRVEKERRDVVTCRRPDSRHKTYSSGASSCDILRHRPRTSVGMDHRRELATSARERFLSQVTNINNLLCRGYTNLHSYEYGNKIITDKNHFGVKNGNLQTHGPNVHFSRPVRVMSSQRNRVSQQEVPKIKYVTEIVQPCTVLVSPGKQGQSTEETVQSSVENRSCILRSKSAPPGNGSKNGKRVSFGPESIFGESKA